MKEGAGEYHYDSLLDRSSRLHFLRAPGIWTPPVLGGTHRDRRRGENCRQARECKKKSENGSDC